MIKDKELIKIAKELKDLTSKPGWAHIEKILGGILESEYVGPRELASLNSSVIAYRVGVKDGILKLRKAIDLNIKMGEKTVEEFLINQQKELKKIQDMQKLMDKHGY